MSLTLANTIAADDLEIEVNGVVPAEIDIGYRFRLDDEFLELRAFGRMTVTVLGGAATESVRNENVWAVARGLEATAWASHTSGASVLGTLPAVAVGTTEALPEPFAVAGASPPFAQSDVTGLVDALADLPTTDQKAALDNTPTAADGTNTYATQADLPVPVLSDTDPGAIGAGRIWIRQILTPTSAATVYIVRVRNAGNNAWLPAAVGSLDGSDNLRGVFYATDGGLLAEQFDAAGNLRNQTSWFDEGTDLWSYDTAGNVRSIVNVNGGATPNVEVQVKDAAGLVLGAVGLTGDEARIEHRNAAGTETQSLVATDTGIAVTTQGTANLTVTGLPTSDPAVAGAVYLNNGVWMSSEG